MCIRYNKYIGITLLVAYPWKEFSLFEFKFEFEFEFEFEFDTT